MFVTVDDREASRSTSESNASGDGDTRSVTDILKQQLKPSMHSDLYTGAVVRKWLCSHSCQIRIPRHLGGCLAAWTRLTNDGNNEHVPAAATVNETDCYGLLFVLLKQFQICTDKLQTCMYSSMLLDGGMSQKTTWVNPVGLNSVALSRHVGMLTMSFNVFSIIYLLHSLL